MLSQYDNGFDVVDSVEYIDLPRFFYDTLSWRDAVYDIDDDDQGANGYELQENDD
jgi:hypothetical protein